MTSLENRQGYIWQDGHFVDWQDAKVHVLTHTLHYGMGAFEGIRAYPAGDQTLAIFKLQEHVDRLFDSAHILKMTIGHSKEEVFNAICQTLQKNDLPSQQQTVYIRPLIFYGFDPQGSIGLRAKNLSNHLIIAAWTWGSYLGGKPLNVVTSSFARHHVNVSLCRSKTVGHYTNSMLAVNEATSHQFDGENSYDEAILLDTDGYVAEGSGENIFVVKNGQLFTPETGSMLLGITRDTVITLAQQELGMEVIEKRLTRDSLYIADEVFLVGTAAEVNPVISYDRRQIGDGKVGKITAKVSKLYSEIVTGKQQKYKNWLTYVD